MENAYIYDTVRSPRGKGSHTIKRVVIFSDTSALAATVKLLCREEAAHRLSYFDGKSDISRCKLFLTCQTPCTAIDCEGFALMSSVLHCCVCANSQSLSKYSFKRLLFITKREPNSSAASLMAEMFTASPTCTTPTIAIITWGSHWYT